MSSKSQYIPALDGLRALAVIAVILYHMNADFLPGGLLGVTMFFVLSGYLITGLLIKEWAESKTINLPRFWLRRVRRLVPAIVFVLAATAVLTGIFAPDMFTKLRNDLPAALLFFTNWWYIFQDVSYFEAMGAPSPVTHFWSLAIEEQFYLIWPPVLLLLFRSRVQKASIRRGLLVVSVISVVLMALLYTPGGDPSRAYYGTDTRAFSLLIGAWLAFVFPASRLCGTKRTSLDGRQKGIINIAGVVALAGVLVMLVLTNGFSPFMYYGGTLLFSLLTGVLILSLVNPANLMAKLFALPPFVWIGKLSYSMYLWHYPILLLMNPRNFTGDTAWFMYVLQFVVILVASAVSYFFVETPIRHGAIGNMLAGIRAGQTTLVGYMRQHVIQWGCGAALLVGAALCLALVPPTATQENTNTEDVLVGPVVQLVEEALPLTVEEMLAETPGSSPEEKACNTNFLMIGDSVARALGDEEFKHFSANFPSATLDAKINRQFGSAVGLYQSHVENGWNGPVVVVSLGTNGPVSTSQMEELIAAIPQDKHVFFINNRMPDDFEGANNEVIWDVTMSNESDRVYLIDWYSNSANHDEYFDGDGTHLTPNAGCKAYMALLVQELAKLYA